MTVKNEEATFAVESMTASAQLRKRNMEGFCDLPSPPLSNHPQKSNSLTNEPLERTLKSCDKNTEVQLLVGVQVERTKFL